MYKHIDLSVLISKTFTSVSGRPGADVMTFVSSEGDTFQFVHHQRCCEQVSIEDVDNDLDVLVGSPLLMAEERTQDAGDDDFESATWTFYTFATVKGTVTVRWLGTSNGSYSERVDLIRVS